MSLCSILLLAIFWLICPPPLSELHWLSISCCWSADATSYVLVERQLPEVELKADSQGRKQPQFQIALIADKMITSNYDRDFPELTKSWRRQLNEKLIDKKEYERKRQLLVGYSRYVTSPKVQLVDGPNGKKYGVAFSGPTLVNVKFEEALERDRQRPDFQFHVKSSKDLGKRLNEAHDEANWELEGRLTKQAYLATNGRRSYDITVGGKRNGRFGRLKDRVLGPKVEIEELKGSLHTRAWEKQYLKANLHQKFEENGWVRPGLPGSPNPRYEMGKQQMLDTVYATFAEQSRHLTEPGTAGPTSTATSGLVFPPVTREDAGDGPRSRGNSIGRSLSGRRSHRGQIDSGVPERVGKNDLDESMMLRNLKQLSIFQIVDNLERGGELSAEAARLKREQIREKYSKRLASGRSESDDWEMNERFGRRMLSRRPFRGKRGKSTSSDSARNPKPPPVPTGTTKWARTGKKRVGKAARRFGKMFG